MKLFGKVLLSFSAVIILFVCLGIYSLVQTSKLKTNGDELNEHGVQPSLTHSYTNQSAN